MCTPALGSLINRVIAGPHNRGDVYSAEMVKHRLDNVRLYANVSCPVANQTARAPSSRLFVLAIWFDGANPSRGRSGPHAVRKAGACATAPLC